MDIEKLISIVNAKTPLWDMRDKRYQHRDVQRKLWLEVAKEMGIDDVTLIKKKWQGLRDVLRKGFNKISKGRSEDEAPLENTSTWPHFESMLFLKDIIVQRKLQGSF
ncbi:unnamed protein product [Acanthoscelides obtectus]|uniref:MADF domain-containing protein n=1 Tax=Acanthoscelides obtectus TaxID=200917 RepID=A0A9P0JUZ5_ACAOB|nr:unnamed protein product [Acanthoscelides obtectus]CAK1633991.1 hypothetical protein AOBTE_LOCUS8522 [Acanthoscelides obtectus]